MQIYTIFIYSTILICTDVVFQVPSTVLFGNRPRPLNVCRLYQRGSMNKFPTVTSLMMLDEAGQLGT